MNFNGDLSKIPLPPYPIPGLSDLIEELPQTAPGQLHSLPHHDNRHEAVSRVLTTPDPMLVSQIVDAFATNPVEHINPLDSSQIENVNRQPLMHGIVPSDMYGHRNLIQMQGGLNTGLSQVPAFVPTNAVAGNTVPAMFGNDPISNSKISSLYPAMAGNTSRPVSTRPVQAVAPQPRNPQVSGRIDTPETQRPAYDQKLVQESSSSPAVEVPQQQENPKICLKINKLRFDRRTKKAHKEKKHSRQHSNEYGIVASESKPDGAGPIKLKISRLKSTSSSSQQSKGASSEQTFKVSALSASETSVQGDGQLDEGPSKQDDSNFRVSHDPAHFDLSRKSSKSERHGHKHQPLSKANSSSQWSDNVAPQTSLPKSHSQSFQQSTAQSQSSQAFAFNQPLSQSSGIHASEFNQQMHARTNLNTVPSKSKQLSSSNSKSAATQQTHLNSQYMASGRDQTAQHVMQQQKQLANSGMLSYHPGMHNPNPIPQYGYNSGFSQSGTQNQSSFPSNLWDMNKQSNRNLFQSSLTTSGVESRPPSYNDAIVAQQRMQDQLYQSLHSVTSMSVKPSNQKQTLRQTSIPASGQPQQQFLQQHQSIPHQQDNLSKLAYPQANPTSQDPNQQQFFAQQQASMFGLHQHNQVHQQKPETTSANYQHQPQQAHQLVPSKKHKHAQNKEASHRPHATAHRDDSKPRKERLSEVQSLTQPSLIGSIPNEEVVNHQRHASGRMISAPAKSKKKGLQHVRVKFAADDEEANIYKLKDIMYPDDTEVSSFEDLQPGDQVIAKWPMNGRMYNAVVVDPLDNTGGAFVLSNLVYETGRKFRDRKPPPKPFQVDFGSSRKDKKRLDGPSVVLDKLAPNKIPTGLKLNDPLPDDPKDSFNAYNSMADRIKLKRRERLANEEYSVGGKKRKRTESSTGNLITVDSDESDSEFDSPSKKRSHQSEQRKRDRRRMIEMRFSKEDGAGAFQRLTSIMQRVFDDVDALDPRLLDEANSGEKDASIPQALLLSHHKLQELSAESAKLKAMDLLSQLPRKMLVRLLTILELNIRDGAGLKPMKPKGATPEEQKWNRDCRLERVYRSTEAALTVMYVMTARHMPKAVYIDDVIERTVQLLRQQLVNTIYPEYDPVYKTPSTNKKKGVKELMSSASTRMKRAHFKGPKNRHVLQLYHKLNILLHQMVELVEIQPLTDTSVLQISSLGISPFFVENVRELQLSAIRLTTSVFSRYDKHRSLILEDIFQSLARLPTSKRNLRNYRLTYAEEAIDSSDDEDTSGGRKSTAVHNGELQHIQMMTALVLQMIHAIAYLPLPEVTDDEMSKQEKNIQHQVDEMKVISSYDTAVRTGQNFLAVFLKKCASKSEEIDYRPLFENLIHDLLATVNKPEWPASEMLLSVLGRLLVHTFSTKSTEMSLRVAALDYLGVVAAKLRRDAVTSITDVKSVQALLTRLEEASRDHEAERNVMELEEKVKEEKEPCEEKKFCVGTKKERRRKKKPKQKRLQKSIKSKQSEEDDLTGRLQYLLLGYLRRNTVSDPALLFAHNFYLAQWLRDISHEFQQLQQRDEKGDAGEQLAAHSRALQACQAKKDKLLEMASSAAVATQTHHHGHDDVAELKKINKISEMQKKADKLAMGLTVEDAALLSRHLASNRSFSRAFDCYLSYILRVRDESAVALRTRAIKCLAEVVAVDPSIMERDDIAQGVQSSLVDASTSVREAAIDLVGKFILLKPGLVKHYYNMLTARILDTGVSVRKRVIKILRDLCHEHPDLPQLTDACVKMIRRVNDEEGIKKLVHEVFMKMWFSPIDPHDNEALRKRALLITDIVAANKERGYEWIEQLFKNLIDTPVRNPQVEEACRQIVNCLVEHVIVFENPQNKSSEQSTSDAAEPEANPNTENDSKVTKTKRSVRLVATVQTLVQLTKIRPKLLVPHVMTLQPYLATKCETADDMLTIHGVCRTLELAIPLMEHPSEAFLASIEEDMMRMILTHRFHVVSAAVACLSAITCRVTHNYRLIWDCFQRMCNGLNNAKMMHEKNPASIFLPKHLKQLLRTLFIIGHFCKNFDFDDENVKGKANANISVKDKVYDCLFYFTNIEVTSVTEELCGYSVAALGLLMVQDPNMMFRGSTRDLYKTLLDPNQKSVRLKKQVLQNLQNYLQTEDTKMQAAAEASAKKAKHEEDKERLNEAEVRAAEGEPEAVEDIKEICDVSSGMASSVMQLFLKQVLEAFFHRHVLVRHAALHTIYLTLQQGLVHPVQCVPYLIAAASDPEPTVHKEAEQQLVEMNKRYHGFVHTKALQGVRLAYQLQCYTQSNGHIVRGFLERSGTNLDDGSGCSLKASCSQLYQLVRSDRKHRRALLLSLLNMFDDTIKTDLKMLVFVADNLAYFPYHTLDEPLHLISQIEVYVSVSGSNVLQSFKESLQSKEAMKAARDERRAARIRMKEEKKRRREARERSSNVSDLSSSSSSSSSSSESSDNDDDDSDDEGAIESRLPVRDEAIEEFASLSLACLLLLWLKQHLKTVFGFTDNKIHRYSPTEVNRANDKQCHRRRADLRFDPKPALEHIDRVKRAVHCREPEYLNAVIKQYNEFNELMNKLDPNDDDSDSDKEKNTSTTKNSASTSVIKSKESDEMDDSDRDTDGETKQVGTLDAIRQSTALKSKKSKKHDHDSTGNIGTSPPQMRNRAAIKYMESSSESEEEFRGF